MRNDCCWYVYEKDCNAQYCRHIDHEDSEEDDPCSECRDYYTIEDAKADAKYRDKDKY